MQEMLTRKDIAAPAARRMHHSKRERWNRKAWPALGRTKVRLRIQAYIVMIQVHSSKTIHTKVRLEMRHGRH